MLVSEQQEPIQTKLAQKTYATAVVCGGPVEEVKTGELTVNNRLKEMALLR
jgi:hypothetical protein